jgi:hypothetical protein
MVSDMAGWCGNAAVDPQMHQAAAVALPQTPLTMPLMVATEFLAGGRIIARRRTIPKRRHLRPGEKLELRHEPFSRIRIGHCQPSRRVDHAKSRNA